MDKATADEKARKAAAIAAEANKKRPLSASTDSSDAKRQKLEQDAASTSAAFLPTLISPHCRLLLLQSWWWRTCRHSLSLR